MKKISHITLVLILLFINNLNAQYWQWAKTASASQPSLGLGSEMNINYPIIDSKGDIYVCGMFSADGGTAQFDNFSFFSGNSANRALFLKYNGNSNVIWAKSTPYEPTNANTGIITSLNQIIDKDDNRIIAGSFSSSSLILDTDTIWNQYLGNSKLFFAKYDKNEILQWTKSAEPSVIFGNLNVTCIRIDKTNSIYISGYFSGLYSVFENDTLWNYNQSSGYADGFLAKYYANGDFAWVKQSKGLIEEFGYSIALQNGFIYQAIQSNSPELFIDNQSIQSKMTLAKYDTLGNLIWLKGTISGEYNATINDIISGSNNELYFNGTYFDSLSFVGSTIKSDESSFQSYLCKSDTSGKPMLLKNIGKGVSYSNNLTMDTNGYLWASGSFYSSKFILGLDTLNNSAYNINKDEIFITKLDTSMGLSHFAMSIGCQGYKGLGSIMVVADSLYVTGSFSCPSITFGNTTFNLQLAGNQDWFFAKYVLPPLGVDDVPIPSDFSIHPNPFTNQLVINKTFAQEADLLLYDGLGKLVVHQKIKENSSVISTEDLPNGLYFYTFINAKGERLQAGKLMKE